MKNILTVFGTILLGVSCMAQQQKVSLEKAGDNVKVLMNGALFTEYIQGDQKPYLYPIIGPNGLNMTRNFPMKDDVAAEKKDHPWHTSVYFTHGDVNGHDFWNDKSEDQKACRIVLDKILKVENATIVASHKWLYKETLQCTDVTEITFSGDDTKRIIDYNITLTATNGDLKLGDTKEGCMAIRMHHKMRLEDMGASVMNSEGDNTGKGVWGKKARWITYSNEIDGAVAGISMMDHPENLRYPTTWHAREYGLCAANPFGLQYFTGNKKNKGDHVLKAGESLSFKYRLVFHTGNQEQAAIDALHSEWIKK